MHGNTPTAPLCPYCSKRATLRKGAEMPFRGNERYAERWFWTCFDCKAWVGCHPLTTQALGTLANADLRKARADLHKVFDPLWTVEVDGGRPKHRARPSAYGWLARRLGIPSSECHIGMFDLPTCEKAIAIVKAREPAEKL